MSNANSKLERLTQFLGEKKLKQLGLIPCSTCLHIMEQAASFVVPADMDEKTFLTPEDISKINKTITQSASNMIVPNASSQEPIDNIISPDNNNSPPSSSDKEEPEGEETVHEEQPSGPLTITLGHEDMVDEATFLKKLRGIISAASPINKEDLGMGYLYNYPIIPLPHSLSCSECGRLYAIAHPTLELLPLPVYLSDTEYEMIKGIYVDTLL